ncbi:MAG: NAD-dependent epimerase/dehydratase family protein, partial [Promethearchaeota archaeon]
LVEYLLENRDYLVLGMVLKGTDELNLNDAKKNEKFSIIYADLLEPTTLDDVCRDVDLIFHLAALVTDWAPSEAFMKVIYHGTENLVNAAIKNGVNRLVYMSSLTVYGLNGHAGADESTPINPIPFFPYAVTKAKTEEYLYDVARKESLEIIIIRPGFDIVGPRNMASFYPMLEAIEKGKFGFINGGEKLICLVYVKNLVAGMVYAAELTGIKFDDFIISDVSWTWKKYVKEICTRLGPNCKMPSLNVKFSMIAPFVRLVEGMAKLFKKKKPPALTLYRISVPRFDIDFKSDKIRSTGFKPPFKFEDGLTEAIEWYKDEKKRHHAK